jgi:hypothetical protein
LCDTAALVGRILAYSPMTPALVNTFLLHVSSAHPFSEFCPWAVALKKTKTKTKKVPVTKIKEVKVCEKSSSQTEVYNK